MWLAFLAATITGPTACLATGLWQCSNFDQFWLMCDTLQLSRNTAVCQAHVRHPYYLHSLTAWFLWHLQLYSGLGVHCDKACLPKQVVEHTPQKLERMSWYLRARPQNDIKWANLAHLANGQPRAPPVGSPDRTKPDNLNHMGSAIVTYYDSSQRMNSAWHHLFWLASWSTWLDYFDSLKIYAAIALLR